MGKREGYTPPQEQAPVPHEVIVDPDRKSSGEKSYDDLTRGVTDIREKMAIAEKYSARLTIHDLLGSMGDMHMAAIEKKLVSLDDFIEAAKHTVIHAFGCAIIDKKDKRKFSWQFCLKVRQQEPIILSLRQLVEKMKCGRLLMLYRRVEDALLRMNVTVLTMIR